MLGVKTAATVVLAAAAVGGAAATGRLDAAHLASLGASACFAVGLFAGVASALVAAGARPRRPSRVGFGVRKGRVVLEDAPTPPRDLPAAVQRALLIVAFGCVGLGVFTNPGTARLTTLPADLGEPSTGEFCKPEKAPDPAAEPEPPPAPVEIPGCALVKRAYALGYAKSLGSCAPREAPVQVKAALAAREPCRLRQLDEPYLHWMYRRMAGTGDAITTANPIAAIDHAVDETRTQLDHLDALLGAQRHAVTGTPHARHAIFVSLPDPVAASWLEELLTPPHCDARYADLPLWPAPGATPSALVEHVLGQLLFAARFGTTASCRDYAVVWGAPVDACARLTADPAAVLAEHDLLEPVREVLDRRRKKLELRVLDAKLDRKSPPEPPLARTLVSFTCFAVDPAVTAPVVTGRDVVIDGEAVSLREIRVREVRTTGSGVIDLYTQLATALGGEDAGPAVVDASERREPPPAPDELAGDDFVLTRLDRLHGAEPFAGTTWPLDRGDLVEVYPFQRHLRAYVDAFRRRYRAQRGRL
jgi:hypothetical protein